MRASTCVGTCLGTYGGTCGGTCVATCESTYAGTCLSKARTHDNYLGTGTDRHQHQYNGPDSRQLAHAWDSCWVHTYLVSHRCTRGCPSGTLASRSLSLAVRPPMRIASLADNAVSVHVKHAQTEVDDPIAEWYIGLTVWWANGSLLLMSTPRLLLT